MAEGIILQGSKRSRWQVGSLLGTGAFGQVHELLLVSTNKVDSNNNAEYNSLWVVKLAPNPIGTTKKQAKRAANILSYEAMMYLNNFPMLQGCTLPFLPGYNEKNAGEPEPPKTGDVEGYKFLVMERMKLPLWSVIQRLTPKKASTTKILVGPFVVRLIAIVESIHRKGYLLVDVKPDNFMFVSDQKTNDVSKLASAVRLLDLGLVDLISTPGFKHRPDENNNGVVGTALYASLNVHKGHTPSRRDDLEALGYMVAELVIRLVAALDATTKDYEKGSSPCYLPWSTEKSDDSLGKSKADNVTSLDSVFYARMGQGRARHLIHNYLTTVGNLAYPQTPDYKALCDLLLPLEVEASTNKAPRSPQRLSPLRRVEPAPAIRASARTVSSQTAPEIELSRKVKSMKHQIEDDFEYDEDAPRRKKTVVKMDKSKPLQPPTKVVENIEEVEDMEIDYMEASSNLDIESSEGALRGQNGGGMVELVIKTGPRKGQRLLMKTNETDVIIIGSGQPAASNAKHKVESFPNDTAMAARHAKLQFHFQRGSPRVVVTDLKSSRETRVNSNKVASGKSIVAFAGDEIHAGTTTLLVTRVS